MAFTLEAVGQRFRSNDASTKREMTALQALGGNEAYGRPPVPDGVDTSSRMLPGRFDPKLAQRPSLLRAKCL
ncbi:hypothetical protein ABIE78_003190 [Sinorhizobium fredii]|nr:hypothetical protein CO676_28900 [Sinorhizobium sp. BJ1]